MSALSHCTRDVRSFFSCCWETNPPLLFLACFKSLTGIRRIQVKITGGHSSMTPWQGMHFGNAKKLEPEILSWPLHSYMNHPKRNEKCRQLLFLSRYHNEHVSVETETPKIHATCTSSFMTKKSKSQTYAQSNSASERFKAAAFCKENYPIPSCPSWEEGMAAAVL